MYTTSHSLGVVVAASHPDPLCATGSLISHDEQTFHSIEIDYSNKEAGRAVSPQHHMHPYLIFVRLFLRVNTHACSRTVDQGGRGIINKSLDQLHSRVQARITDHFHFTMAALDQDGAVFASKGKRSSDTADSDDESSKRKRGKRGKQLAKKSNDGIPSAIFFRPAKGGWANKRYASLYA